MFLERCSPPHRSHEIRENRSWWSPKMCHRRIVISFKNSTAMWTASYGGVCYTKSFGKTRFLRGFRTTLSFLPLLLLLFFLWWISRSTHVKGFFSMRRRAASLPARRSHVPAMLKVSRLLMWCFFSAYAHYYDASRALNAKLLILRWSSSS